MALPAAAGVTDAVSQAARRHLLDAAADAGLADASVALSFAGKPAAMNCPGRLSVDAVDTRHPTRMKFVARCEGTPAWHETFIVRGEITATVVVASARVPAGQPIGPGEVALEKRPVRSLDAVTPDLDAVVGQSSRRALRAGQAIDPRTVVEPVLVRRSATVSIVATNGALRVTTRGEALAAGRAGDVIDVRNTASGRVIRARVTGQSTVEPADMPVSPMPHPPR